MTRKKELLESYAKAELGAYVPMVCDLNLDPPLSTRSCKVSFSTTKICLHHSLNSFPIRIKHFQLSTVLLLFFYIGHSLYLLYLLEGVISTVMHFCRKYISM